jgi:hypothetical protein
MVSLCSLPKNHHYRIQFYSQRESLGKSVLGKAIIMKELNKDRITSVGKDLTNRSQLYSESIFCLILPGDLPPQNRFFDALLHGCIPLVPLFYESSNALPLPSTHDNPTSFVVTSVPATYPYGRFVQFHGDALAGIDWLNGDMMVTFDGACGAPCARQAMEQVMNNVTKLRRAQDNLKTYAPMFTYGLEQNMYQNVDAFYALCLLGESAALSARVANHRGMTRKCWRSFLVATHMCLSIT